MFQRALSMIGLHRRGAGGFDPWGGRFVGWRVCLSVAEHRNNGLLTESTLTSRSVGFSAVKVPEFSLSYLHLSIMVFIDLLQSPLQPLQFRLPFPLHPANGLERVSRRLVRASVRRKRSSRVGAHVGLG